MTANITITTGTTNGNILTIVSTPEEYRNECPGDFSLIYLDELCMGNGTYEEMTNMAERFRRQAMKRYEHCGQ